MIKEKLQELIKLYNNYMDFMNERIYGYEDINKKIFIMLLSDSNCLLESAPGLGKTSIVKHFSNFFNLDFSRIQFTPDLMPLDIIGSNIIQDKKDGSRSFDFFKGPIFSNIILGDEINRASPKTQSAFLEAMEEKKVTLLGEEYKLDSPFIIIATQNPIELEGTYPLPEAQIDRFMMKLYIDYPELNPLIHIIQLNSKENLNEKKFKKPDLDKNLIKELKNLINEVEVSKPVYNYVSELVYNTHPKYSKSQFVKKFVLYGASPRAGIGLIKAAKWNALLDGRINVSYEDVDELVFDIFNHRILLNFEGEAQNVKVSSIIDEILRQTVRTNI